MKVRYQADYDLNQVIVKATVRLEPAIDFRSAHAAGLEGMGDPAVLAMAAEAGRILVTHDQRTMPRHFAEFIQSHISPGVLIIPQSAPLTVLADDLLLIWLVDQAADWMNRIRILPL